MRYPEPKVIKAIGTVVRQYPEILEWLGEWRTNELEALPYTSNSAALAQGRCQVLGELYKFAKESPDIIRAKSL